MNIGMMANRAMKKNRRIPKKMIISPTQSGIRFLLMLFKKGEKRIARNPEKKRIVRTELRSDNIYAPHKNARITRIFWLNNLSESCVTTCSEAKSLSSIKRAVKG